MVARPLERCSSRTARALAWSNPISARMFRRALPLKEIPGDYSMMVAMPTIRAQAPPLTMAANSAVS
jgi:hypothetical protein